MLVQHCGNSQQASSPLSGTQLWTAYTVIQDEDITTTTWCNYVPSTSDHQQEVCGLYHGALLIILQRNHLPKTVESYFSGIQLIFRCESGAALEYTQQHADRWEDGAAAVEKRGSRLTSPRIYHYLALGIEYQTEDGRRLRVILPYYWKWIIYSEERKTDGWDTEPDRDWHSIFLNSNPITSPQFPYG